MDEVGESGGRGRKGHLQRDLNTGGDYRFGPVGDREPWEL